MKKIEIEFSDSLIIGAFREELIFNVKMDKELNSDLYKIKVTVRCDKRKRRNTFITTEAIKWSNNFRQDVDDWLEINDICKNLKEKLKVKLQNNFEYKKI